MSTVVLASSEVDHRALDTLVGQHAELVGNLTARAAALLDAASRGRTEEAVAARSDLRRWCRDTLLPRLQAEQEILHPAGRETDVRAITPVLAEQHRALVSLLDELEGTDDLVRAAATARALTAALATSLTTTDDHLVTAIAAHPGTRLTDLLDRLETVLATEPSATDERAHETASHSCGCDEHDEPGFPELDARIVPHAIRHATIFGALDAVAPGAGLILVAPHDPLPLLAQIEQRAPGVFAVDYIERGPEAWRLRFLRR